MPSAKSEFGSCSRACVSLTTAPATGTMGSWITALQLPGFEGIGADFGGGSNGEGAGSGTDCAGSAQEFQWSLSCRRSVAEV